MTIVIYWVVSEERRRRYLNYNCRHTDRCLIKVYGTRCRIEGEIREVQMFLEQNVKGG